MSSVAQMGVEQRIERLVGAFAEYLGRFTTDPPFNYRQLLDHLSTLERLRGFASVAESARDEGFADLLAGTLKS